MNPQNKGESKSTSKESSIPSILTYIFISKQLASKKRRKSIIKSTIIELIIFLVFFFINNLIVFGMSSSIDYYYTKVFTDLFVKTPFDDASRTTFETSTSLKDFWKFTETSMLNGLFWEDWYDDAKVQKKVPPADQGILYENRILGRPRLRQIRVKTIPCDIDPVLRSLTRGGRVCFPHYDPEFEETKPYHSTLKGTAWEHHSAEELRGTSYWGKVATYSGAGAYVLLDQTVAETKAMLTELKHNLWINRATRVILLEFTVYNANINMFCVVSLAWELPATGGLVTSFTIRSARFLRDVDDWDLMIIICEWLFIAFTLYYTIQELLEMCFLGFSTYISDMWSFLDFVLISVSYFTIGSTGYRFWLVADSLESLQKNINNYTEFHIVSFWEKNAETGIAVCLFLSWIKLFKFISVNKTMAQLTTTLSRCAKDIGGFGIMFFIVFFGFAQLGCLLFGSQATDFSTIQASVFTLLRLILGDFDYREIEAANRVLGPIYFLCYVFFVFLVLLNMFLAIINDTYSEVKSEIQAVRNRFNVTDSVKDELNKRRATLLNPVQNIQENKILTVSVFSDEETITQDELRLHLQSEFTEDEVSLFLARYELVKDHQLEEEEHRRLIEDLDMEGSKDAVVVGDDGTTETTALLYGRVVEEKEIKHIQDRITEMETSLSGLLQKMDDMIATIE